jgi:hypothetical protein
LPLVHDSAAENDESQCYWCSWLGQLGRIVTVHLSGQRFSNADLSIEAAVRGIGVALGRFSLVAGGLSDGTLVSPLSGTPSARCPGSEVACSPHVPSRPEGDRVASAPLVSSVPVRASHFRIPTQRPITLLLQDGPLTRGRIACPGFPPASRTRWRRNVAHAL